MGWSAAISRRRPTCLDLLRLAWPRNPLRHEFPSPPTCQDLPRLAWAKKSGAPRFSSRRPTCVDLPRLACTQRSCARRFPFAARLAKTCRGLPGPRNPARRNFPSPPDLPRLASACLGPDLRAGISRRHLTCLDLPRFAGAQKFCAPQFIVDARLAWTCFGLTRPRNPE